jgi:hypothetical protein
MRQGRVLKRCIGIALAALLAAGCGSEPTMHERAYFAFTLAQYPATTSVADRFLESTKDALGEWVSPDVNKVMNDDYAAFAVLGRTSMPGRNPDAARIAEQARRVGATHVVNWVTYATGRAAAGNSGFGFVREGATTVNRDQVETLYLRDCASVGCDPAPDLLGSAVGKPALPLNPYRALFVGQAAAPLTYTESVAIQAIERVAVDPIVAVEHAADKVLGRLQAPGYKPNYSHLGALAREIGATRAIWWSEGPDKRTSTLHVVFIRECAKAAC